MDDIFWQTREAAYTIMALKGATYYAIGAGLADIIEAILRDQSTVLSVSSLIQGYCGINGVCLSLPAALDQGGVEWVLPMNLDPQETEAMCQSAQVLKTIIAQLKLE
jgi:L-lactate dehydrogenase